ncbi:MAG: DUF4286 family protein [Myxococcota bacterium]
MSYRYTVRANFLNDLVAQEWVDWLRNGHCSEVLDGGATKAEVVALEGTPTSFEVRYDFPDRATFERYEGTHAPRLRAEGLELFPMTRGVEYFRSTGTVAHMEKP